MTNKRFWVFISLFWVSFGLFAQPIAEFTADTTRGCVGGIPFVNFQDLSSGGATSWFWDFGDPTRPSVSNLQNPTFSYTQPGCYDVTLVVTNALGADTIRKTCFVEIWDLPQPNFTMDLSTGCAPLTVQFSDASIPNAASIAEWTWSFSDGQGPRDENPVVTFLDPDTLDLTLTVRNSNGCVNTFFFPDTIVVLEAPILDFTVDNNSACEPPLIATITNNTITNGADLSYVWQFPGGDPVTFNGPNPPPIEYTGSGNFDVTLISVSNNNCSDTLVRQSFVAVGNVQADFTVASTTVCVGDPVLFTNTSTGGVNTVEWDFGDGNSSTATNPTHTYGQIGSYPVILRANNPDGCGDTTDTPVVITVVEGPQAGFMASVPSGCLLPFSITFTDTSTNATSWLWDFGDGTTSTDQNPVHNYTNYGEYDVLLTVFNNEGCSDTVSLASPIRVALPEADFMVDPAESCLPATITMTDNSISSDSIVSWEWVILPADSILPSNISTDSNPSFNFTGAGTYSVTLTIETQQGCRDSATLTDIIRVDRPPMVDFTVSRDQTCVNDTLNFTTFFTDPDWSYSWDFMYDEMAGFNEMSTQANPVFAYPDTGVYSVAFIINNQGCRDTLIKVDTITVDPPRANFSTNPSVICGVPGTFTVVDSSVGPVALYEWFLDDVLVGNTQDPGPLTINTLGQHVIKLRVTGNTGCIDSMEMAINAGAPIADFSTADLRGCKDYPVTLINNSTNAFSYSWSATGGLTSGSASPIITFPDTGFKDIQLIATDIFGCSDTLVRPAYVEVLGPYAAIAADDSAGCIPFAVQFSDETTPYRNSNIVGWNWDFGDPTSGNNTSTLENPSHVYNAIGSYTVSLEVLDSDGCRDSITMPDFIIAAFPTPDFAVSDSNTCAGNPLQFSNLTMGIGGSYIWDFGDGNTSTAPEPVHAYADTGVYDVTLIVTDEVGCIDSLTKQNFITIEPFFAEFSGDPLSTICAPLITDFYNLSEGNLASAEWSFGDGSDSRLLSDTVNKTYLVPGNYTVSLEVTHEDGCVDSETKEGLINIGGPFGEVIAERAAICLGDTVVLTVLSNKANRITVDFLDGTVVEQSAVGDSVLQDTTIFRHVYQQAADSGDYVPSVFLIEDQPGQTPCVFPIPRTVNITVIDKPIAAILPSDTTGCAPADFFFEDASTPGDTTIVAWEWRFSDGDSSDLQNTIKTFPNVGVYDVELKVVDEIGCADSTSIQVRARAGAIPNFVASDSLSCAPVDIQFTDQSTGPPVLAWEWYFGDSPALGSISQNPIHTYNTDGLYSVTMVIFDEAGCTDSITKVDYINLRHPVARIEASDSIGCNPAMLTFYSDSSITDTTFSQYLWCITDIAVGSTQCLPSPDSLQFSFANPGDYTVELIVRDALGCTDTSESVAIMINERVIPPPITMTNVTVNNDTSVTINFTPYALNDFMSYAIYRRGPSGIDELVGTLGDQNATTFTDQGPSLNTEMNSYCYTVLVENTCAEFSLLADSEEHCTIELTASPAIDAIDLVWNPYVGFLVAEYQVLRVFDYDTLTTTLIGTVPGNVTMFTDTALFCRDSVTYRILAIDNTNTVRSYSDISVSAPIHEEPIESINITTATVVNDTFIEVSWLPYQGYKPDRYVLEKSPDGSIFDTIAVLPMTELNYTDTDVAVDEQSYTYRVSVIDSCGDVTPMGNIGKSIWLNVSLLGSSKNPVLSWTPYQQWDLGVLSYEVEILNEQTGTWELIEILPGTERTFIDDQSSLFQSTYCYRVRALEVGGNVATALSNEDCVTFAPLVFTPNAFTPNGDGHNDRFNVYVPNLNAAELSIYDRWGELLYRTLNLDDGWDGTFRDRSVPEGVYVFVISGIGEDGTNFTRTGTVTLIR